MIPETSASIPIYLICLWPLHIIWSCEERSYLTKTTITPIRLKSTCPMLLIFKGIQVHLMTLPVKRSMISSLTCLHHPHDLGTHRCFCEIAGFMLSNPTNLARHVFLLECGTFLFWSTQPCNSTWTLAWKTTTTNTCNKCCLLFL